MKKLFYIMILMLLLFSFSCFDDESSTGGTLVLNITNSIISGGMYLAGVYTTPNITAASTNPAYYGIANNTGNDTITISGIKDSTVYFAVLLDEDGLLSPTTGENYFLYNGKTYGTAGDPVTITGGETTTIDIDFDNDSYTY